MRSKAEQHSEEAEKAVRESWWSGAWSLANEEFCWIIWANRG